MLYRNDSYRKMLSVTVTFTKQNRFAAKLCIRICICKISFVVHELYTMPCK